MPVSTDTGFFSMVTDNTVYSIAILAGGQSRRMGQNKAHVNLLGKPVLQWVIDAVSPLTDDLFLVTNTPTEYRSFNLRMVGDILPGNAALGGIYTALFAARHPWVFLLACDMPLVRPAVISLMATLRYNVDVVVPRITAHPESLHAFYRKTCVPAIESRLAAKQLRVVGFFDEVTTLYVPAETIAPVTANFSFLTNLNTPADVQRVRELLENRHP